MSTGPAAGQPPANPSSAAGRASPATSDAGPQPNAPDATAVSARAATAGTYRLNAPAAPDREILVELLGLHARVLRRMPWVEALLVVGMGLFMYPYIPAPLFLTWGALTVGVETARAQYAARVLSRAATIDPRRTHFNFMLLAVAAGPALTGALHEDGFADFFDALGGADRGSHWRLTSQWVVVSEE